MKKKVIAIALTAAMIAGLAACGGSASGGSTDSGSGASGGSVRLLNGKPEINDQLQELAKKYKEETGKDVTIETIGGDTNASDELKKMYQADNMPDIFVIEANQAANWDGLLVDLAGEAWTNDTDYELVDKKMGTIGFPYTVEATALAYNADILEKAGVDPASITGPESMRAAFETLDGMKDELGLTAVIGWCAEAQNLYWSTGSHSFANYLDAGLDREDTTYFDMMMNEGKLDHDRFTHFAEMVDLFNHYSDPALLVSGNYDMQVSGFAAGKYAFVTQGSWIGSSLTNQYKDQYAAAGNFECGYVPYCFEEGIDTILTNAPSHWAVYKDGNVADAEAFLSWLAGPDGQQIMVQEAGCVSPFKSCTVVANDPFAGPVSEYAAAGKTSAWHWMGQPSNMAQDGTGAIFQDFAMGNEDVASFVEAMASVIPDYVK